jgi:hypothetical protein
MSDGSTSEAADDEAESVVDEPFTPGLAPVFPDRPESKESETDRDDPS